MAVLISHYQAKPLLEARARGDAKAVTSLDLNLTKAEVTLTGEGVVLPRGGVIPWALVEEATGSDSACFSFEYGVLEKVQAYSEEFERAYSLYPTAGAPTMLISGIPMHRIKGTDPHRDTLSKLRALGRIHGRVLDTATGLGYTAIQAAKTADEVVTVELDPVVLELAQVNPWSAGLFAGENIAQIVADVYEEAQRFEDASFDFIIHDPPQFGLAGELYSGEFYRHLRRILKPRGRLFHYIGDPGGKMGGGVTRGVVRRLGEAGFERVERRPRAFGVVAAR